MHRNLGLIFVLALLISVTAHHAIAEEGASASPSTTFVSESITCETPTGRLYGTLTVPTDAGTMPCALIIAGSGPTDRDGNSKQIPGKNNSLAQLAEGLAARGIASLRFDKRGVGESASAATGGEAELRFTTYIDDAVLWARLITQDARFSRLVIVGHSEGSLIGMIAARTSGADGFVSVAGVGRPAADVILGQLKPQLPPAMLAHAEAALRSLADGKTTDDYPPELASLFRPSVQPYMISWFKYNPADEIAKLSTPSLIIQGTTDIQVSIGDADLLAKATGKGTNVIIEGMNHVLKNVPADQKLQLQSYGDPSLPIAPHLVEEVARFLTDGGK